MRRDTIKLSKQDIKRLHRIGKLSDRLNRDWDEFWKLNEQERERTMVRREETDNEQGA